MSATLDRVIALASEVSGKAAARLSPRSALDQDLGIHGDAVEELIEALCDAFGVWVAEWPWRRFVEFNEPGYRALPRIWKFLRLPNAAIAFPGIAEERLELGHIAAVVDNGQWFDP